MGEKICNNCEIKKELNQFRKSGKSKTGYGPQCLECVKLQKKRKKKK